MTIQEKLFANQDKKYALFQSKLTPNVDPKLFIGVRVPVLRKMVKGLMNEEETYLFLDSLPHKYYDENMCHGLILSELKDYEECIERVDEFLPYVDNWAVCDIMSPKIFKKNKDKLIEKIKEWSSSSHTYVCRFGMEMLMSHFLDDDFKPEYNEIVACVKSDEYYVNMMIAWYFATALAKQWDSTITYIDENRLSPWVHNKTIQKSCESYRITDEQKAYLKQKKIKL